MEVTVIAHIMSRENWLQLLLTASLGMWVIVTVLYTRLLFKAVIRHGLGFPFVTVLLVLGVLGLFEAMVYTLAVWGRGRYDGLETVAVYTIPASILARSFIHLALGYWTIRGENVSR